MWTAFEQILERVRKVAVNLVIVFVMAIVAYSIYADAWSGSYLIEPISGSGDLADKSEDVAARLRDEVGKLALAANNVAIKPISPDEQQPEVKISGTDISLRYFVNVLRSLIGAGYKKVEGQVTVTQIGEAPDCAPIPNAHDDHAAHEQKIRLTLSLESSSNGDFLDCKGSFTRAIQRGALETLKVIDPLTAANYIGQSNALVDKLRAKSIAEATLASERANEWPIWLQRLSGRPSKVPEGLLAIANVKLSMKDLSYEDFKESEALFKAANEAYKLRNRDAEWFTAYDGIATKRLLERDYDGALSAVNRALGLKRQYNSSLYHLAQIYDDRARDTSSSKRAQGSFFGGGIPKSAET